MIFNKIPIKNIQAQSSVSNREKEDVQDSAAFIELMSSIRNTKGGLIHPVSLREIEKEKYELFIGYRRFLAYNTLFELDGENYEHIPAFVYPKDTPDTEMLSRTIHENLFRKNLSKAEALESRVSIIPFFLNCGEIGNLQKNRLLGYKILKSYASYSRAENKEKYFIQLRELTGLDNPIESLSKYFDNISIRPENLLRSAKVILEYGEEIAELFKSQKISERNGSKLGAMKSDSERRAILERIKKEELSYTQLENLIKEANERIKEKKKKRKSPLVVNMTHTIKMIEEAKIIEGTKESEKIREHLMEIEKILQGE